ncbi:RDD family protein [Bordetella bronchialis]|uniref:RDD family protein 2 n=1 Tax=Bordetella bronchialis TaxID=463025 RepID=A0A193FVJ2_9BORD|nr:RDD family protein [Bordetella bronchialis]ANN66277.1 RDD family protein 2 [Bordetella bronchialis]ANN71358.1 RDD family protein 2 [Bordetella bronchialis]
MNDTAALPAPPRLRRFACMMYEAVLLFGVVFLADYLFDTLTQSRSGLMLRSARQLWLFLAIGGYFLVCWRRSGQTLPMKTWNIRLVGRDGATPSLARLAWRYVLAWLLPLLAALAVWAIESLTHWPGTLMFIVAAPFAIFIGSWLDPDGQFLHDRWAGTRLVSVPAAANAARGRTAGA